MRNDRPNFIYLPHSMPHVPLHVSEKFKGKSGRGLYGDVIMELDWSVGQIQKKLDELSLNENTFFVFTSDNGPWLEYGNHGGSAGPLREGKWTTFDDGQRIPCVMKYTGQFPAGAVSNELITEMDFFTTFARLAGAKLPSYPIDGKNIWQTISDVQDSSPAAITDGSGPASSDGTAYSGTSASPHDIFLHYRGYSLEAIRDHRWKLHLPHTYLHLVEPGKDGIPGKSSIETIGMELFDMDADISERKSVVSENRNVVERLLFRGKEMDREIMAQRMAPGEILHDGVFDGTRLFVIHQSGGDVIQPVHPCGKAPRETTPPGTPRETAPSNSPSDHHLPPLIWHTIAPNDSLTVGASIPSDGEYRISLTATGAGRFRVMLGKDVLAEALEPANERILIGRDKRSRRSVQGGKDSDPQSFRFLGMRKIIHGVQSITFKVIDEGEKDGGNRRNESDTEASWRASTADKCSLKLWNIVFELVD